MFRKKNNVKNITSVLKANNKRIGDYLPDWIRIIDPNGIILYENEVMIESNGNNMGEDCYNIDNIEKGIPLGTKASEFQSKDCVSKNMEFDGDMYLVRSSPMYNGNGELFAIVESFRNITIEVISIRRYEEVAKKTRKELNDAKNVQMALLPEKGEHNGICVDYRYIPSQFLSGDMFDIISLDDDTICLYIADVVGHGVSASLITMFIRQTVRSLVKNQNIVKPNLLLGELTKKFAELNLEDNKYFTIFYGVYTISKNEFIYVNAGHNAIPIKMKKDKSIELIEGTGLPISFIFAEGKYVESKIRLNKGDKILFYTDGITETKDYFNELYGIDRLIQVMKKNRGSMLDNIVNSVSAYRWGAQEDDIAIMLIERMDDEDDCKIRLS
ncbi:MAG: PP2C family protein-serine/threonine phosphatase [Miniphocaeibacter sp.]|jgi:sigma-B regulation protein RsbU (phosphoserine phosphatase)|uniref:SpoIIE family protein phosphatase n=1 Tax=Miniphocaeibacter sp. TaxID=3100973 RepID=UPI0017C5C84E|nr:serine/threonine-protein phosphatase [Gallicola sp.]